MQYRIKVTLPEVYDGEIQYWMSKLMELDEEEKKATVRDLMRVLTFNEALYFEDEDGSAYFFPPELLSQCVVSLIKCEVAQIVCERI